MQTTLDLPDELVRALKIRAMHESRTLKHLVVDLLQRGLTHPVEPGPTSARVRLPLVHTVRPASVEQEMTPERVAEVLAG